MNCATACPAPLWLARAGAFIGAVGCLTAAHLAAQPPPAMPEGGVATDFIGRTATEAAALLEASQLVQEESGIADIRDLAKETSENLMKLQADLKSVTEQVTVRSVAEPDADEKGKIIERIKEAAEDGDIGDAYVDTVVDILDDMGGRFKSAADDDEVNVYIKAFAERYVELLEYWHQRARNVNEKLAVKT